MSVPCNRGLFAPDARGPGLLHRLAAEAQREYLRDGGIAIGRAKYGRPDTLRAAQAKSAR